MCFKVCGLTLDVDDSQAKPVRDASTASARTVAGISRRAHFVVGECKRRHMLTPLELPVVPGKRKHVNELRHALRRSNV